MKENGEIVKTERIKTSRAELRTSLENVPKGSKVALGSVGFCRLWRCMEICDIKRFSNPEKLAHYAGLVPSVS
jgi:transposase